MDNYTHRMATIQENTFTKIFVGGLPYHTTDEGLREFFGKFGDIDEAVVIMDRQTGKSKGYGFVTMADVAGAERACLDPNPIIDGRKANVNLAYLGAKPRGVPTQAGLFAAQGAGYQGLLQTPYGMSQFVYPAAAAAYATGVPPGATVIPTSTTSPASLSPTAGRTVPMDLQSAALSGHLQAAYYGYPLTASAGYMPATSAAAAAAAAAGYSPYMGTIQHPQTVQHLLAARLQQHALSQDVLQQE